MLGSDRFGGAWSADQWEGAANALLQMEPEAYAALLREQGYSENYIAQEFREPAAARERHDLPGPAAQPARVEGEGEGLMAQVLQRRRGPGGA